MTTPADALAALDHLGVTVPRLDGGAEFMGVPATLDGQQRMVADMVADLDTDEVSEFVETYAGDDWHLLVACSSRHPELGALVAWADAVDDVLFIAGPRGPRPPAVFFVERGPNREQ